MTSFKINTTGATSGAGTAYPFGAHEFTPVFSGVRVAQSLVFCVVHCKSSFFSFFYFVNYIVCPSIYVYSF